jgi:uncharacterized protein YkwD
MVIMVIILQSCEDNVENKNENLSIIMLQEVNKLRKQGCNCGDEYMPPVSELKWNELLEKAAYLHSKDMYENNYFDHFGLDSSLPIQRAAKLGYTGTAVGENIAHGFINAKDVIEAWKNSISHCKNMMDSCYDEMGASHYKDYWTQEFGSNNIFEKK